MKSLKLYLGILLIVSLLASCKHNKTNSDANGVFEAVEILVSAETSGKILQFAAIEGQKVAAEQVVSQIDTVQLDLRKRQLQATLRALQSRRPNVAKQIASLQQQIATAKSERQRVENLLKSDAANQKQLDDIDAQIAVFEKQLDAQQSTLQTSDQAISGDSEALEMQIEQLADQLRKCRITSPISGVILAKYAEKGELAVQGKPLFKIADIENMNLRAYITADQLNGLKIGQKVKIFVDAQNGSVNEYDGALSWVSEKAEFTPKSIQTRNERANSVYAVKIAVKNDGFLKIGMYGEVKFN